MHRYARTAERTLVSESEAYETGETQIIKKRDYFFDQSLDEIRVLRYLNNCPHSENAHLLRLHDYFYNKQHLFIVTEVFPTFLVMFSY